MNNVTAKRVRLTSPSIIDTIVNPVQIDVGSSNLAAETGGNLATISSVAKTDGFGNVMNTMGGITSNQEEKVNNTANKFTTLRTDFYGNLNITQGKTLFSENFPDVGNATPSLRLSPFNWKPNPSVDFDGIFGHGPGTTGVDLTNETNDVLFTESQNFVLDGGHILDWRFTARFPKVVATTGGVARIVFVSLSNDRIFIDATFPTTTAVMTVSFLDISLISAEQKNWDDPCDGNNGVISNIDFSDVQNYKVLIDPIQGKIQFWIQDPVDSIWRIFHTFHKSGKGVFFDRYYENINFLRFRTRLLDGRASGISSPISDEGWFVVYHMSVRTSLDNKERQIALLERIAQTKVGYGVDYRLDVKNLDFDQLFWPSGSPIPENVTGPSITTSYTQMSDVLRNSVFLRDYGNIPVTIEALAGSSAPVMILWSDESDENINGNTCIIVGLDDHWEEVILECEVNPLQDLTSVGETPGVLRHLFTGAIIVGLFRINTMFWRGDIHAPTPTLNHDMLQLVGNDLPPISNNVGNIFLTDTNVNVVPNPPEIVNTSIGTAIYHGIAKTIGVSRFGFFSIARNREFTSILLSIWTQADTTDELTVKITFHVGFETGLLSGQEVKHPIAPFIVPLVSSTQVELPSSFVVKGPVDFLTEVKRKNTTGEPVVTQFYHFVQRRVKPNVYYLDP